MRKIDIYKSLLRHPTRTKKCTLYKAGGIKRDDRVMAFIIGWILAPRDGNHGQLLSRNALHHMVYIIGLSFGVREAIIVVIFFMV